MQPPVETVRISQRGRDLLIKLKRNTGIDNWNILCRWALLISLSEKSAPSPILEKYEGGVEIQWKVFAGEISKEIISLIKLRSQLDGFETSHNNDSECLKLHIHRGLGYLTSGHDRQDMRSIFAKLIACKPTSDAIQASPD
jgi:DNA sulfur modification protein DndE